jgi:hypothetical protein
MNFETKDSGKRKQFSTGMQRDMNDDKPMFSLINPLSVPYNETLLYRWAMLMTRGAKKYNARNWEKAGTIEELMRFRDSAERHFRQAMDGEVDEDHFAAVLFNLNGMVYLMYKLNVDAKGNLIDDEI